MCSIDVQDHAEMFPSWWIELSKIICYFYITFVSWSWEQCQGWKEIWLRLMGEYLDSLLDKVS